MKKHLGDLFAFFFHFGPGLTGSFGALLVGWLVVVAQAVSRKTPIYFILINSPLLMEYLYYL